MRSSSRPPPSYSSAPPPGRICRICATCCPLLRSTVDLTVPPSLRRLLEALHAAGGRPFLVGGAVRDAVLGLPIAEYDVEVCGLPAEALKQQLAARFELTVDPATAALAAAMPVRELPAERIFGEIEKLLLKAGRPSVGLALLREWGLLPAVAPELVPLRDTPQDPQWHPEGDVWTHTL